MIALFICSMPALCSSLAAAISAISEAVVFAAWAISFRNDPLSTTSSVPFSTFVTDSLMSCSISFAAPPDLCARFRTSPATTAKPRPWSPARGSFNSSVQSQQVCLESNFINHRDNLGNFFTGLSLSRLLNRLPCRPVRLLMRIFQRLHLLDPAHFLNCQRFFRQLRCFSSHGRSYLSQGLNLFCRALRKVHVSLCYFVNRRV
jgi:hypothetical protein